MVTCPLLGIIRREVHHALTHISLVVLQSASALALAETTLIVEWLAAADPTYLGKGIMESYLSERDTLFACMAFALGWRPDQSPHSWGPQNRMVVSS